MGNWMYKKLMHRIHKKLKITECFNCKNDFDPILGDQWISVKDQLPKDSQLCVVYKKGLSPDIAVYFIRETGNCFTIGQDVGETYPPDYWYPIPKFPMWGRVEDKKKQENS